MTEKDLFQVTIICDSYEDNITKVSVIDMNQIVADNLPITYKQLFEACSRALKAFKTSTKSEEITLNYACSSFVSNYILDEIGYSYTYSQDDDIVLDVLYDFLPRYGESLRTLISIESSPYDLSTVVEWY